LAGHDFDCVLVAEVVGALDRVEGVRLPGVTRIQRGVDPALRCIGVGANRVDLADDPYRYAFLGGREGGALSCEASANYENVMSRHERGCYRAEIRPRSRDWPFLRGTVRRGVGLPRRRAAWRSPRCRSRRSRRGRATSGSWRAA